MQIGKYEIDIQANTTVGFDHGRHPWSPVYRYLDADSLMAAGLGQLHATGHTVWARACTTDPDDMRRVADRFRELTGVDLPVQTIKTYDMLGIPSPVYEFEIGFSDCADKGRAMALYRAFAER